MFERGLVIGKFYPPHRGHKYLIDTALSRCREVVVLVCDHPSQTIPAALRADWLREIHPKATVRVVPDELDPDDSQAWAAATKAWLGYVPDAVFTSEDYGHSYARYLGCVHVLVDRSRTTVPVSGTAIRTDPLGQWEFLEPCVRAYFARRVVVVGAESTGTTTLARALAEHYQTVWVPEYGRFYYEGRMHAKGAEHWTSREFVHIARMQNEIEDTLARRANRLLIADTDSFATTIWHERYVGHLSAEVEALAATRHPALYLLTGVDIAFVQDGTRDGEHLRQWMHARFGDALAARRLPFVILSGSHNERMREAISRIDPLLA